MKLKFLCFLYVIMMICFSASQVKAQATGSNYFLPTIFPRSPNTTSMEKFGSYEVNLFTGLPSISIPLYTIEAGGIKIPVTLSYHASGIKVSDVSSWVGLGWGLSAGGNISRSISGKADDGIGGYLKGNLKKANYYSGLSNAAMDSLNNYAMGVYDSRPDIFSYDFPGHGGKFFLDGTTNYTPKMVPFAPVKVTYSNVGNENSTLDKFYISDENGNKYLFGDTYLESTVSYSQASPGTGVTTGWPLKSAISQNRRDTVNFTYAQQTIYYPDVTSPTDMVTDSINVNDGTYTYGYKKGSDNVSASYVNEQLLQQINFKNGKIVFVLDTAKRKDLIAFNTIAHGLKDIQVWAYNFRLKAMEIQKTIRFFTSNFNSGGLRMKLDSIQILDKAGSIIQHYRFGYNYSVAMPAYGAYAKDYWGYYNGKTANTTLTPHITVQTSISNGTAHSSVTIGNTDPNSRNSDSTFMQACMLDTIKYPTGGYSVFTYQTNQYLSGGVLQQAGGLRIKSISSYDGVSAVPIIKTYQYDQSQARANFYLNNYFFYKTQTEQYWGRIGNNGDGGGISNYARLRTFVSNPSIDIVPWDAANVVYPHVTEYIGTPGTNIGKTDYYFRDQSDTYLYPYMYQEQYLGGLAQTPIINSYFYARGQLLTKTESLRKTDGTYQTVMNTSNTYSAFPASTYYNVGLVVVKNTINTPQQFTIIYPNNYGINCIPAPNNDFAMGNYHIVSDDNYLVSTTTQAYDTADPTKYSTSAVSYKYDDTTHQQIAKTIHTDSKGNIHITNNKFPYTYLNGGATTNNAILDSMINRHMYAVAIEKIDSLKNPTTSLNAVTGGQLNRFKSGTILNTIVPSTISILGVNRPVADFVPSVITSGNLVGDSRYTPMISFDQYDTQNNIAQYTTRNSTPVSILWDYLYGNPIAQVKNSGAISYAYTSFEADGKGNWSYTGTPVVDATAPTGSKVYPLSSGAVNAGFGNTTNDYVLSYWSNNGPALVYYGSGYITGTAMGTTSNWTYYEHKIPAGSSYPTISGSTSIDELRYYPAAAQVTTYAYEPAGVTDIADTKGGVSNFEYDPFQRLKNVKDWYGNIVNNYSYHTYDQTIGNDATSGTFTRNNCPLNTSPTSTTYAVPINKYYSSTKASANAEAVYDKNVNGQIKANILCGCPITKVNITLSNSTGHGGYQATFTGGTNPVYNFPSSGSLVVQVDAGTYTSVAINAVGSFTATFTLGARTPVTAHFTSFSMVVISPTSTDSSISIQ